MNRTSDHKTFCAFGAYAVNVIDPAATVVLLLAEAGDVANGILKDKLVTLDLNQRLGVVSWEDAILDDMGLHSDGAPKVELQALQRPDREDGIQILTVGPSFFGPHWGGIYIERSKFFGEIRRRMDPDFTRWPAKALRTYEIMSSALRANGAILRYHGFHATVIESDGSTKKLVIKRPNVPGEVTVTVDLNDRAQCDDPALMKAEILDPDRPNPGSRLLDAGSKPNDEGGVFLALKTCAALNLSGPKEPPGGG